jgi:hypothetical protein
MNNNIIKRRPLETGAFGPALDPSDHSFGVVCEEWMYVSSVYVIGRFSKRNCLIFRKYRLRAALISLFSISTFRLVEVFLHLYTNVFK